MVDEGTTNDPVQAGQDDEAKGAPLADDAAVPVAQQEDLATPKPAGSPAWQAVSPPGKPDGEVDTRP